MIQLLLTLSLLIQGIPVRPSEGGTVIGTVRTTDGKPAVGVRVAARARSDSLEEAADGASLAGISETDAAGHYRLEGVPPGRYTVSAGRVDLPTYYPGTLDLASGTVLAITPGSTIAGIDFTLADLSFAVSGGSSGVAIPVRVTVEGGGRIPVFADGKFVRLAVTPFSYALDVPSIVLPFPVVPRTYPVAVENLPAGYTLKSMMYGSTNLMQSALRISARDISLSASALSTPNAAPSPAEILITLASGTPAAPATAGARVTGRATSAGVRSIYLSGIPGTLYSDGTFEFRGVPPGRQTVITEDNPPSSALLVASLVVGDRNIDGVELDPVPLLPRETPASTTEENHPPGSVIPLAALRGRLVSEATQQPLRGVLNVMGGSTQVAYPIGADGQFDIPKLLPGSYILQASVFDYFTINETVVVGEKDISVELRAKRAY